MKVDALSLASLRDLALIKAKPIIARSIHTCVVVCDVGTVHLNREAARFRSWLCHSGKEARRKNALTQRRLDGRTVLIEPGGTGGVILLARAQHARTHVAPRHSLDRL